MQLTSENLSLIMFSLMLFQLITIPIGWGAMHLLTPKTLLERYFKEPHFNQGELFAFQVFPTMLLRTGIFIWACIMPQRTKGRYMTDIREYAPSWYLRCAKIFAISTLSITIIWAALLCGLWIEIEFFE